MRNRFSPLVEVLFSKAGVRKFPKVPKKIIVEPPTDRMLRFHQWVTRQWWMPMGFRLSSSMELTRAQRHRLSRLPADSSLAHTFALARRAMGVADRQPVNVATAEEVQRLLAAVPSLAEQLRAPEIERMVRDAYNQPRWWQRRPWRR